MTIAGAHDPISDSFIVTGDGAEIMAGLMTLGMARSMHREARSMLVRIEEDLAEARRPLAPLHPTGKPGLDRIYAELAETTRRDWIVSREAAIERVRGVVALRAAQVAAMEVQDVS